MKIDQGQKPAGVPSGGDSTPWSVRVGGDLLRLDAGLFPRLDAGLGRVTAVAETIGLVAGLDDVAVMGEAVEERRRHLRVAEDARPLGEDQIRRDDDAGVLVQLRQQVKEQGAA